MHSAWAQNNAKKVHSSCGPSFSFARLPNHFSTLTIWLFFQCLFDPNKGKSEELDLAVFNPLSQEETVSISKQNNYMIIYMYSTSLLKQ